MRRAPPLGGLLDLYAAGIGARLNWSVANLVREAGHAPVLQGAAIVAGTFILEDAATVVAAMQVQSGAIALPVGVGSLYLGIMLGDLGLYGLGRLASQVGWIKRLIPRQRDSVSRRWLEQHVFKVVFASRFIPGARLPTYTACGFVGADLQRFSLAVVAATLIWTSLLFGLSLRVGRLLIEHFGAWRWVGAGGFIVFILILERVVARLNRRGA